MKNSFSFTGTRGIQVPEVGQVFANFAANTAKYAEDLKQLEQEKALSNILTDAMTNTTKTVKGNEELIAKQIEARKKAEAENAKILQQQEQASNKYTQAFTPQVEQITNMEPWDITKGKMPLDNNGYTVKRNDNSPTGYIEEYYDNKTGEKLWFDPKSTIGGLLYDYKIPKTEPTLPVGTTTVLKDRGIKQQTPILSQGDTINILKEREQLRSPKTTATTDGYTFSTPITAPINIGKGIIEGWGNLLSGSTSKPDGLIDPTKMASGKDWKQTAIEQAHNKALFDAGYIDKKGNPLIPELKAEPVVDKLIKTKNVQMTNQEWFSNSLKKVMSDKTLDGSVKIAAAEKLTKIGESMFPKQSAELLNYNAKQGTLLGLKQNPKYSAALANIFDLDTAKGIIKNIDDKHDAAQKDYKEFGVSDEATAVYDALGTSDGPKAIKYGTKIQSYYNLKPPEVKNLLIYAGKQYGGIFSAINPNNEVSKSSLAAALNDLSMVPAGVYRNPRTKQFEPLTADIMAESILSDDLEAKIQNGRYVLERKKTPIK